MVVVVVALLLLLLPLLIRQAAWEHLCAGATGIF
jgi:hypothetical protein